MKRNNNSISDDLSASLYDENAKKWNWNPEVIFGLMHERLMQGQKLLDLGIGTGLCSRPFHRAGLEIYGIDKSEELLRICNSKNTTSELKTHDLNNVPWPFRDRYFEHIICGGVFHLFGDLSHIFSEVDRILKPGGMFGFTVSRFIQENEESRISSHQGFVKQLDEASGEHIFFHGDSYINGLIRNIRFNQSKTLIFVASINPDTGVEHICKLYIAEKTF